jgi:hypothetical protein
LSCRVWSRIMLFAGAVRGEEGKKMAFYLDHMKHAAQLIQAEPASKAG